MSVSSPSRPHLFLENRYRWVICLLLFFATAINYMDRQILSLLKPVLDHQLHWSNEQFGWINSAFQFAYAGSYLAFGWFVDKYGAKIGYSISIIAWSIAAAGHAMVSTVSGFGIARVALGLGEGGNFPAAIKSITQWFPRKERAFATTLFNSGSNVGALLAPAIIPPLALAYGWQSTFLVVSAAGFLWLIAWLVLFDLPRRKNIDATELTMIEEGHIQPPDDTNGRIPWKSLLGYRQTWGYLGARFLTDPVWWFFLIWLPDYFKKTRDMDIKSMGLPLITIYVIVTVLSIAGGWTGKWLADRGWSINRTRKVSLLLFAIGVLPVLLATHMPLWIAVALIGVAGGCHQAWSATLYTTVSDVFPSRAVASLVGLGGLTGSVGGIIFPIISGYALDRLGAAGYPLLFGYCGLAYLVALLINHILTPRFEPITL